MIKQILEAINPDFKVHESIKALWDRWMTATSVRYRPLTSVQGETFRTTSDDNGVCVFRGDKAPRNLPQKNPTPEWLNHFSGHSSRHRVLSDLNELEKSPVEGITVCFDGPGKLRCYIKGPKHSPYEGTRIFVILQADKVSRWSV
jgi:hypothetical protein